MTLMMIGLAVGVGVGTVVAGLVLMERRRWWFEFAVAVVLASMVVAIAWSSKAGEMVLCASVPGHGPYVYRDVEGRKCWFAAHGLRRGREKPLEELKWPRPMVVDPSGWSHSE